MSQRSSKSSYKTSSQVERSTNTAHSPAVGHRRAPTFNIEHREENESSLGQRLRWRLAATLLCSWLMLLIWLVWISRL